MKKSGRAGGTSPRPATPRRLARLLIFGAIGAGVVFTRVIVEGDSMTPTLEPGDRLLVLRLGHRRRLRPGDIVTLAPPAAPERPGAIVKRVADCDGSSVEVTGDNPAQSTDSRSFGRLPLRAVTGKAIYRYAPRERAGILQ